MKRYLLFSGILFIPLVFTGCGSTKDGERVTEAFFELIKKEEFEKASKLLSADAIIDKDPVLAIKAFANNPKFGKFKSYK